MMMMLEVLMGKTRSYMQHHDREFNTSRRQFVFDNCKLPA